MIIQDVYLEDWDWVVKVYYAVDTFYIDSILDDLESMGCSLKKMYDIEHAITQYPFNNGLTYSNTLYRWSLVVIGITETPEEFQNTFDHEKGHLAMHIAETDDIDVFGEEFQYLTGEIGKQLFPVAKKFMCEHCRIDVKGSCK